MVLMTPLEGVVVVPVGVNEVSCSLPLFLKLFLRFRRHLCLPLLLLKFQLETSAMTPRLIKSGLCFSLGDRHTCSIIVRHDWIVDVITMDGRCVVSWPFAETVSGLPLLFFGVDVPDFVTGELVVTTHQHVAPFDPARPLGVDENPRVRTAISAGV